jgi:GT2 family glycosyltransferase
VVFNAKDTVIIIPVHNRRATTVRCLSRLRDQGVLNWASVVVVDDGSTDGTIAAIQEGFSDNPPAVLRGDGTLWWAGGINRGLEYAFEKGFDYVIWLNDDCLPVDDALLKLRAYAERNNAIVLGQATTPSGGWYGGYNKTFLGLRLLDVKMAGGDLPCDTFAGNAVCMPLVVAQRVGKLDATGMPMTYADVDWGLRARSAGFQAYILHAAVFQNQDNMEYGHQSWLLGEYHTWSMWRSFFSVKSPVAIGPRYRFFVRHWGMWGYLLAGQIYIRFWLMALVRFVFPLSVLRRLFGNKARMWQKHKYHNAIKNRSS